MNTQNKENINYVTTPIVYYQGKNINSFLENHGSQINELESRVLSNLITPGKNEGPADTAQVLEKIIKTAYNKEKAILDKIGLSINDIYSEDGKWQGNIQSAADFGELFFKTTTGEAFSIIKIVSRKDFYAKFVNTFSNNPNATLEIKKKIFEKQFYEILRKGAEDYLNSNRTKAMREKILEIYQTTTEEKNRGERILTVNSEEMSQIVEGLTDFLSLSDISLQIPEGRTFSMRVSTIRDAKGKGVISGTRVPKKIRIGSISVDDESITKALKERYAQLGPAIKEEETSQKTEVNTTTLWQSLKDAIISSTDKKEQAEVKNFLSSQDSAFVSWLSQNELFDEVINNVSAKMNLAQQLIPLLAKKDKDWSELTLQEVPEEIKQKLEEHLKNHKDIAKRASYFDPDLGGIQIEDTFSFSDNKKFDKAWIEKAKALIYSKLKSTESTAKGAIGEAMYTLLLGFLYRNEKGESGATLSGNKTDDEDTGYQSAIDIKLKFNQVEAGIQLKLYSWEDDEAITLYGDSSVALSSDNQNILAKYLNENSPLTNFADQVQMLQFLRLNQPFYQKNRKQLYAFTDKNILEILGNRVGAFMRYNDYNTQETNLFYIVNEYVIPSSMIFNELLKQVRNNTNIDHLGAFLGTTKNPSSYFDLSKWHNGDDLDKITPEEENKEGYDNFIKNQRSLINHLKDPILSQTRIKFKGVKIYPTKIGKEIIP